MPLFLGWAAAHLHIQSRIDNSAGTVPGPLAERGHTTMVSRKHLLACAQAS